MLLCLASLLAVPYLDAACTDRRPDNATPHSCPLAPALHAGSFAEAILPSRLRDLLSAESSANDGFALPFVMLPTLLMRVRGAVCMCVCMCCLSCRCTRVRYRTRTWCVPADMHARGGVLWGQVIWGAGGLSLGGRARTLCRTTHLLTRCEALRKQRSAIPSPVCLTLCPASGLLVCRTCGAAALRRSTWWVAAA